jgi:hypothetical protein
MMNRDLGQTHKVWLSDVNTEISDYSKLTLLIEDKSAANSTRFLNIGGFFYTKRFVTELSNAIVINSFDLSRTHFITCFAEYLRQYAGSHQTAKKKYSDGKAFLDWIDSQKRKYKFDDKDDLLAAYRGYSNHLLMRCYQSGINQKPLGASTALYYQKMAAILVGQSLGLSQQEVMSKAPLVEKKPNEHMPILPLSAEENQKFFKTLLNVLNEICRITINEAVFPAHFSSEDDEDFYFYTNFFRKQSNQVVKFDLNSFLVSQPHFPDLDVLKSHFKLDENSSDIPRLRLTRNEALRALSERNEDFRHRDRVTLAEYGMVIGLFLFILTTGSNLDVTQHMKLDSMKTNPSTKGRRFAGVKGRANGKTVYPEFGVSFEPIFKKILQLREWYLDGRESTYLFPMLNSEQQYMPIGAQNIQNLKKLLMRFFPKIKWITPTQARKHVSKEIYKISGGDLFLESEKLGHTFETARKNYLRNSTEDSNAELSSFFKILRSKAVDASRSAEKIDVKIIPQQKTLSITTPVGVCERDGAEAIRQDGFTEQAPQPNCLQPETCLFCQYFALHADEEDIRKLTSLRFILVEVKQKATDCEKWEQQFGVILHRINEILDEVIENNLEMQDLIERVELEVQSGDLDDFWANHFEMLVALGWVE